MYTFRRIGFLLIFFSVLALAQTAPAPELQIVRFGWNNYKPGRLSTETDQATASDRNSPPPSSEERRGALRTQAELSKETAAEREARKRQQEQVDRATLHSSLTPEPGSSYQYKLEVKNTSQKQVTELQWDYVFADPRTRLEQFRYHFASRTKIKPGKSAKITIYSTATPYLIVNAAKAQAQEHEKIVLRRIMYADGSVWNAQ